jgi:hypothetical protein
MESFIDPDDSSNSNSRFENSDCSTDAGDLSSGPAGSKQTTQVGHRFLYFVLYVMVLSAIEKSQIHK